MRELTGTDAKWIAKGYWDNHFTWKVHPKARTALIIAGVAIALVIALGIASWGTNPTPDTLSAFAFSAFATFMVSALWAVFIHLRERDAFLDIAQQQWEAGKVLPDRDTVRDFIKNGGNG